MFFDIFASSIYQSQATSMEKLSRRLSKSLFTKTPKELECEHFVNVKKLKLYKEIERRKSFVENDWFLEHVEFVDLALQGFYYFKKPNCVKCIFCHVELDKFDPNDDLLKRHLKFSPNCPLLRRRKTNNKPVDAEELEKILPPASYDECGSERKRSRVEDDVAYPDYRLSSVRLKSFDKWPIGMKQTPKDLSDAGFFFAEDFEGELDATICYACGLIVVKWDPEDNPWVEHNKLLTKECSHLKSNKSQLKLNEKLFKESQNGKTTDDKSHDNEDCEREIDNENVCKICFSRKSSIVYLPCQHVAVCEKCTPRIKHKCPICRSSIKETIKLYYA